MTKTRSQSNQATQEDQNGQTQQDSHLKISKGVVKSVKLVSANVDSTKKSPNVTSKVKQSKKTPAKPEEVKDPVYSDLVNLTLIKKFDMEAVLDQTGNAVGDCHLPRGKFLNYLI